MKLDTLKADAGLKFKTFKSSIFMLRINPVIIGIRIFVVKSKIMFRVVNENLYFTTLNALPII